LIGWLVSQPVDSLLVSWSISAFSLTRKCARAAICDKGRLNLATVNLIQ